MVRIEYTVAVLHIQLVKVNCSSGDHPLGRWGYRDSQWTGCKALASLNKLREQKTHNSTTWQVPFVLHDLEDTLNEPLSVKVE